MSRSRQTKSPLRSGRLRWGVITVLAAGWAAVAIWGVPAVIRAVYHGTAFGFLSPLIEGRGSTPLDSYLAFWRFLAVRLTLAALIVVPLVAVSWSYRKRIIQRVAPWLTGPEGRRLGLVGVAVVIVLGGVVSGLVEAVWVLTKQMIDPVPNWQYRTAVVWTAPLVNTGAFLGLAAVPIVVTAIVGWIRRRQPTLPARPVVFLTAVLASYVTVRMTMLGIAPWAGWLLAAALAAQVVRFSESRRRKSVTRAGVVSVALVVLALPPVGQVVSAASDDGRPSILLIILDTVRARQLGLYGGEDALTPGLDSIAETAVVFDRAVAPSSWTLPSHGSMLSGTHPHELSTNWSVPLHDEVETVGEVLSEEGYATAAFVANYYYTGSASGVAQGFDTLVDHDLTFHWVINTSWLGRRLHTRWQDFRNDRTLPFRRTASTVSADFLAWLDQEASRPYFAFLNYYDAHDPYRPPDPSFVDRFAPGDTLYWVQWFHGQAPSFTPDELGQLKRGYEATIAYLDREVTRMLVEARRRGHLDNTLVVITSDHGEQFGEQDPQLILHGNTLAWTTLHVPLIVIPPGESAPRRVEEAVSLRHLAATFLDVAASPRDFPGTSLAPVWNGGAPPTERPAAFVRPHDWALPHVPIYLGPMGSIIEWPYHWILLGDGSEELYDLDADPLERTNLIEQTDFTDVRLRLRDHARDLGLVDAVTNSRSAPTRKD